MLLLRPLHLLLLLGGGAALTEQKQTQQAKPRTSVTLRIPASQGLPNPNLLPPSTHATLSALGAAFSAPLTVHNTFVFSNLSTGSYLVDVHCATHAFAPLRLDVVSSSSSDSGSSTGGAGGEDGDAVIVRAWETYRGNDWDNKGEAARVGEGNVLDVKLLGGKGYFMERSKFNAFAILRNPMILLGLVSMGIFLGLPYLVDNMDPEMRAEWEERQKSNPMNGIMGAATGQPGAAGGFDMAAFLAGSSSAKKEDGADAARPIASGNGNGNGDGGGKKKKR